ncbi:MAG: hypothetical protein R6W82_02910 [bacterium]
MSKVIIGVHGLGNKPPEDLLASWWKRSLREGLTATACWRHIFRFRLAYWAHHLHPEPRDPRLEDPDHPLYLREPYRPSPGPREDRPPFFRRRFLDYLERQFDRLFLTEDLTLNYEFISDWVIRRYFKDLEAYYREDAGEEGSGRRLMRDRIREDTALLIRRWAGHDILLIGHSMGSIICYDVLTQLVPDVTVDTLVTLGSPLGLPVVMSRIAAEMPRSAFSRGKLRVPDNIRTAWFNLSDLEDRVSFNYNIADDFAASGRRVTVMDRVVENDYEVGGRANPHKVYGYLRTPEMADIVCEFMSRDTHPVTLWLNERISRVFLR